MRSGGLALRERGDFEVLGRYVGIKRAGVGGGFEPVGGAISRNKMGLDRDRLCGHSEEAGDLGEGWF